MSGLSFGWHRDLPDFRDYDIKTDKVSDIIDKSDSLKGLVTAKKRPEEVDLREWCSPVENQGKIGSCTSHAAIGMLEYYHKRAYDKHVDLSRLFTYKASRRLLGWNGDTGAYLRTTMQSLVHFGAPPEYYYPYDVSKYDEEPEAFHYALGHSYAATKYYRLDPPGTSPEDLLNGILYCLAAGLPCMFGFVVYDSINEDPGWIRYPKPGDKVTGGHAVMAVGYNDNIGKWNGGGALLIRNSWGKGWGHEGYGWLPYEYVLKSLAVDFWSIVEAGFVGTDLFK
jgi:C1A family cysteine protease